MSVLSMLRQSPSGREDSRVMRDQGERFSRLDSGQGANNDNIIPTGD